jgi:anti-anti-sigma factor
MNEPPNEVIVSQAGNATVAAIVGEIDIATAPELRAGITDAIQNTTSPVVVIDLRRVTFLGSPGLAALIAAEAQAASRGVRLGVLTGGNRIVSRPLQITGMDLSIPIRDTMSDLEEALEEWSRSSPG